VWTRNASVPVWHVFARGRIGFLTSHRTGRTTCGRAAWLLAAALGTATSACAQGGVAPPATTIEIIDDAGFAVQLAAPARRIISLIPARTDLLLALDAADRIIARTQYDEDARLAAVPSVGNALTPSVEWLTARAPDLVIAWPDQQSRNVVATLRSLGIAVYASRVESLEDVDRSIAHLGTLLGLESKADSLRAAIQRDFARARGMAADRDPPLVAYLVGLDPPTVAGPGTYIDQLLHVAGARNVFGDAGGLWPTISLEALVRRQPDRLLLAVGGPDAAALIEDLRTRPGWRDLRAVRTRQAHVLEPTLFNRPGARVGEAAVRLAELLHGTEARR
jgi:ABC-type Fe3+-hydroxamate transport system substrate-binding protein